MRDVRLAELAFQIEVVKEQLSIAAEPSRRMELLARMHVLLDLADERVRAYIKELLQDPS